LPAFQSALVNPEFNGEDKGVVQISDVASAALPIRALVLPRIVAEGGVSLRELAPAEAFRRFAPNCALVFPDQDRSIVQALGTLARRVPSYELLLGSDAS